MTAPGPGETPPVVLVFITAGSVREAETIARHLVEGRLAACVQRHAIESTYWWQGAVTEGDEVMLVAKTTAALFPALEQAVLTLHSYDVPEIVCVPVSAGYAPYLAWVAGETVINS